MTLTLSECNPVVVMPSVAMLVIVVVVVMFVDVVDLGTTTP